MNISPKLVYDNLDKFIQIYDEKGKEVNPIPEKGPIVVYCESSSENGYCEVKGAIDLGLTALIAQSWILRKDLIKLIKS